MSPFADIRQSLVDRGMICTDTGRLTASGLAYSAQIVRDVRNAPPPPDGHRPYPGARFTGVKWNTSRE